MIFKKLTGIPQPNCKNHGKNFLKEIERPADHGWAKKKKMLIWRTSKTPVSL